MVQKRIMEVVGVRGKNRLFISFGSRFCKVVQAILQNFCVFMRDRLRKNLSKKYFTHWFKVSYMALEAGLRLVDGVLLSTLLGVCEEYVTYLTGRIANVEQGFILTIVQDVLKALYEGCQCSIDKASSSWVSRSVTGIISVFS